MSDPSTAAETTCGVCDAPTSNTPDDNPYDHYILCGDCMAVRVWEEEHQPGAECDNGPDGAECTRDHADEARSAWEELQCDMAKDEGLL